MSITVDPSIKSSAQEAVESIMREVKSAKAVVIATEDGFEVAGRVENAAQTSRLSAMASSFSALGALVGEETLPAVASVATSSVASFPSDW